MAEDSYVICSAIIRPAEIRDIAAVLALDQATTHLPHWAYKNYEAALNSAQTQNEASVPTVRRCLIVAESAGAIAGFAVGSVTAIGEEAFAELESVAVAEVFRSAGLGRALCATIIAWARECGATSIELEVRSRSGAPIALYRSLGFVESGRRAAYYRDPGDDALLMRLELRQTESLSMPPQDS